MRGHYVRKKHKQAQASLAWNYVSENKQPEAPKVPKLKWRTVLLVCAILLLLGLVSFVVYQKVHNGVTTDTQVTAAEKQLLTDAAPLLTTKKAAQLKDNVAKIQATDSYEKSPDLLYVALQYYLTIGDAKNARKALDQFEKVYDATKGYSAELGKGLKSIDTLRADVAFLEAQEKQFEKNAKELPIL